MPVHGAEAETMRCLRSLVAFTEPPFELVVVDDASPGGAAAAVREMLAELPASRLLENDENLGFPRSVNRGLAHSKGEVVVVLNSDVVLTPGWLTGLLAALAPDGVGMAGPITNDSGDIATVVASYSSVEELMSFARARRGSPTHRVKKLSLLCAALSRTALDAVGGLDEGFGRGMFEDDDLCMALSRLGLATVLVESVYVHHSAGSSFRKLHPREYFAQYEVNRFRFENKWRARWHSGAR
jgi:GT2 family glycosyltransferase